MPTILSAKQSQVLLAGADGGSGAPVEGLQAITYKVDHSRQDVAAIGTDERIGVDFGLRLVTGTLKVKSTNNELNTFLDTNGSFQITANLKKGELTRTVAFDQCYLDGKQMGFMARILHDEQAMMDVVAYINTL